MPEHDAVPPLARWWCPIAVASCHRAVNTKASCHAHPAYVTSWGYVIPVWVYYAGSKADINQRWGSGGHILACDMLICPTDTRSKNMPTRQPPYIQPGSNFRWPFADRSSTFQGQKDQNLKLYLFKVKVNWMWGYKRRSRFNCTKYHQDEKWSQAN